jgi:micrococcal nuclease
MKRMPRPYWREPRALLFWILCTLLVVWRIVAVDFAPSGTQRLEEGIHQVRRVVDGDTLLLTTGARVRLQGIDTPETVREGYAVEAWGKQASQFTTDFVNRADRRVRLTFSLERQDRHGRFLAFVWHEDALLNEQLVREGLAHARLDYRYSGTMKHRLANAQDEARRAGRGIWSANAPWDR